MANKNEEIICKKPEIRNSSLNRKVLNRLADFGMATFDGEFFVVNWEEVSKTPIYQITNLGKRSVEVAEQWARSVLGEQIVLPRPPTTEDYHQERLKKHKKHDREMDEVLEKSLLHDPDSVHAAKESVKAYIKVKSFLESRRDPMSQMASWVPLELLRALSSCPTPDVEFNLRVEGNALFILSSNRELAGTQARTWRTRVLSSVMAFRDLCREVPSGQDFYEQGMCAIHQLNCVNWDEELERPWRIL